MTDINGASSNGGYGTNGTNGNGNGSHLHVDPHLVKSMQEDAQRSDRQDARLAEVKPEEDFLTRFKRVWEGPSNNGTMRVFGT